MLSFCEYTLNLPWAYGMDDYGHKKISLTRYARFVMTLLHGQERVDVGVVDSDQG